MKLRSPQESLLLSRLQAADESLIGLQQDFCCLLRCPVRTCEPALLESVAGTLEVRLESLDQPTLERWRAGRPGS